MKNKFQSLSATTILAAALPAFAQVSEPVTADDLLFSVENMDLTVDPGEDFYRFANGDWIDRVDRPQDKPRWGILDILGERAIRQVAAAAAKAGEEAANAPKGSPTQLVGDFYNAFMDVDAIKAAGLTPLQAQLDAIDAIGTFDDLTRFMAEQVRIAGPILFAQIGVSIDPQDSKHAALFVVGQDFGLPSTYQPVLAEPLNDPRMQAYRAFVSETMQIAGDTPEEAERIADLTLAIEVKLHTSLLTPAEGRDPAVRNGTATVEEAQALAPGMNVRLYLETVGFELPEQLYMYEPKYLPVLEELWTTTPLEDLKDYARFRVIDAYRNFLDPAFAEASLTLDQAILGTASAHSRAERLAELLSVYLGHPSSQLYVEAYYDGETRDEMLDIIQRVHTEFRGRIETRGWLSEDTRAYALEKLDAMKFAVGYPDEWIDFSGLDIGSDPVANVMNLASFDLDRTIAEMKDELVIEPFSGTLPTAANAAYQPPTNRFEVAAAITQLPVFSTNMDPALKFCHLGAIAGHEMTHGFDSLGRHYDAVGNLRDWWTFEDGARFNAEAKKLIDLAESHEALPGLPLIGALTVGENLADVGGITLAHLALMTYLDEHPEENVEIDGFNQEQRCFLAWANLWATQSTEDYIRTKVAVDPHPPGSYRGYAPLLHVDAFYEAFDIEEGDPMWLPPEQRVHAW